MKTRHGFHGLSRIKTILCLLAAGLMVFMLMTGCNPPAPAGPLKWEYKVVTADNFEHQMETYYSTNRDYGYLLPTALRGAGDFRLDASLDEQGKQGWELVAAVPQAETTHPVTHDELIAAVRTGKIILIFKRPAK